MEAWRCKRRMYGLAWCEKPILGMKPFAISLPLEDALLSPERIIKVAHEVLTTLASKQEASKTKSSQTAQDNSAEAKYDNDEEEERIRCICGDVNPQNPRAFIGCDSCEVWQHNICMDIPEK